LDMSNVSGAQQVWNDRSTNNLTITDVQNSVVLGLNQVSGNTTFDVTYDDDASGGAQTVVAAGAGTATDAVTLSVEDAGTAVTELSIVAQSGLNNIVTGGDLDDIESLTITGSAALMLAAG